MLTAHTQIRNRSITLNRQSGFSLLEILVAMIIIAIGVLGVAGLQASALKFAKSSDTRVMAVILGNDMMERIRSNHVGAKLGEYSSAYAMSSRTCNPLPTTTAATTAAEDTARWLSAVACALPAGKGKITITAGATDNDPSTAQIDLQWDESRLKGGSATQTYSARTLF
jgi:type IV pilus assembly protein PilV